VSEHRHEFALDNACGLLDGIRPFNTEPGGDQPRRAVR
jgi:hypothetical protein